MGSHDPFEVRYLEIHGYRRAYRMAGSGPAVLLLHGLGCDSSTWEPVFRKLSRRFTVIAPDLLGHGLSDKPQGDYSLGGYANGMRDLLAILDIERVTVVGHSFGGGVAMQFAYQFPEKCARICLVSSGGLGPEVSPLIRMLTVPGAGAVTRIATMRPWRSFIAAAMRQLSRLNLQHTRDLEEVSKIYESFADPKTSWAVRRVTSGVINWQRQLISMNDRAYLTELMPVHVIWGLNDMVIPVAHAAVAEEVAPGAEVTIVPDSGHFPYRDHPDTFVKILKRFIDSAPSSPVTSEHWRTVLRERAGAVPLVAPSAVDYADDIDQFRSSTDSSSS